MSKQSWIETWLVSERATSYEIDKIQVQAIEGVYHYDYDVRLVGALCRLRAARNERDFARTKLAEAQASWRADLDSYNVILCKSGIGDLREKVRNLEHGVMGLMIAYRELAEARATIVTLTAERDSALSRLGEWRERIERMDELA